MSTLVNILLATVLNFLSPGTPEAPVANEIDPCAYYVQEEPMLLLEELKPENNITKDELLSLKE